MTRPLSRFFAVLALLAALAAFSAVAAPPLASDASVTAAFAPGQVIVGFEPGRAEALAAVLAQVGIREVVEQQHSALIPVPVGQERAWAHRLAGIAGVRWAEPNYIIRALEEPSDPRWPQQWWQHAIGAAAAWDISRGDPAAVIAVADTGIDLDHPDRPRLWTNTDEIPANGLDDDGNGKIDDIHGWHWYIRNSGEAAEDSDIQIPGGDERFPNPRGFHGMHVAGIIAAATDNAIGVAGVTRGPQIMMLRVLNSNGDGTMWQVAQAIAYAADNGAAIINLSVGAATPSYALEQAVEDAAAQGVLLVAAAGNGNGPIYYPAAYEAVVAVGGTLTGDSRYPLSNFGPELDLTAPAADVLSTWASFRGGYHASSGTSMAAPQVSGALALLQPLRPADAPGALLARLRAAALDLGEPGWDELFGWGRLRVDEAARAAAAGLTLSAQASAAAVEAGQMVGISAEIRDEQDVLVGSGLPVRVAADADPAEIVILSENGRAETALTAPLDAASLQVLVSWHDQQITLDIAVTPAPTPTLTPTATLTPTPTLTPTLTPSPTATPAAFFLPLILH